MLASADVFVSSYRTGALKRLGLDYDALHKKHPHIVWAQINGFGDFGPAKDNPGFDTVAFWARSGAMVDITEKDTSPVNPPIGFGDATTACSLSGGICAALYQKARTGQGCKVMVSLFAQAIWNNSALVASTQYGDEYPKSRKNAVSPVIDSFQCSDGKWIFLSILEPDRYNDKLMSVLGREDLVGDPRFCTAVASKKNGPELIEIISAEFAKRTQAEMVDILTKADIAHECIQHVVEVLDDPQALANKYVVPVTNLDGTVTKQAMSPVRFSLVEPTCIEDIDPTVDTQAPLIGQHSAEILAQYGYSQAEIEAFLADQVITIDHL
jgi:crotonobetainyl-CoA:carnitine CoA-transferase CaiB-like acyl-CoA transferase